MKILIAEDDYISRRLIQRILSVYGSCEAVADGQEAVTAFRLALGEGKPYQLVFLDIMMPRLDGLAALERIRTLEKEAGVGPSQEAKIYMTTALDSPKTVVDAYYRGGCTGYMVKPIEKVRLEEIMTELTSTC